MVQLEFASGERNGETLEVSRFPWSLGRSPGCDLRCEGMGIWDRHLEIVLDPERGFLLRVADDALASVNGQLTRERLLRNGDLIEAGMTGLRFWLAPASQKGLRWRERLTWAGFGAMAASEAALIYFLV